MTHKIPATKLTKEEIEKLKKELAKKIEKANNGTIVRK